MGNIFQEIESDATIPPQVKEEMISNLEAIKLVADLVDLFFIKGTSVATQALSVGDLPEDKNKNNLSSKS